MTGQTAGAVLPRHFKHLNSYVAESVERHNICDMDTADQMAEVVAGMDGKRPTYRALIADNGLS